MISTIMILMMQIGFALLEVGSIRLKNTSNILLKNCMDTMVGGIVFYFLGYSLLQN